MSIEILKSYLPLYREAAWTTLKIGLLGILLSLAVGLLCAIVKYQKVPVLSQIVTCYVELSRNTPLTIQLFFLYFAILPLLGVNLKPAVCAVIGLTFLGGSYMAESFRSGFESVEKIQLESSLALGLTPSQVTAYIVFPQALTTSFAAIVGNVIFLLKETSVVSIISVMDLMFAAKDRIGVASKTTEALFLLVVFYALILIPVSVLGYVVERRLRRAGFGS